MTDNTLSKSGALTGKFDKAADRFGKALDDSGFNVRLEALKTLPADAQNNRFIVGIRQTAGTGALRFAIRYTSDSDGDSFTAKKDVSWATSYDSWGHNKENTLVFDIKREADIKPAIAKLSKWTRSVAPDRLAELPQQIEKVQAAAELKRQQQHVERLFSKKGPAQGRS
jgi:hypothetical protein